MMQKRFLLDSSKLESSKSKEEELPFWLGNHRASTPNVTTDQELVEFLGQSGEYLYNYIMRMVDDPDVAKAIFEKVGLAIQDSWPTNRPRYGLRAIVIWARSHARTLAAEHLTASGLHPCSKRHFLPHSAFDPAAARDLLQLLSQPLFREGDFHGSIPSLHQRA